MAHGNVCALSLLVMLAMAAGCGGAEPPPAQTPEASSKPAAEPKAKAKDEAAKPAKQEEADNEVDAVEDERPTKDEPFKPDRPPRDIITTEDTTFVFKFTSSEIGEKTEAKCREDAPDDPKAFNECKRKVRNDIGDRILHFKQKHGTWWWITYLRKRNQLSVIHRIAFTFGEETDNTVTILPQGKDKGSARMSPVPRKVKIHIPNSYQIMLEDKQHGKMYYSATIGLLPGKK